MKNQLFIAALFSLVVCLSGCTFGASKPPDGAEPLVVGVFPHYKPIIFKDGDKVTGLEADFARQLAQDLNRPLQMKEFAWSDLFAALERGEVDILMSGVSVTGKRATRVMFTEPYMAISQMAMIRRQDIQRLSGPGALFSGEYRVGFVNGTTGQDFAMTDLTGPRTGFATEEVAVEALKAGEIDFFIHDAPTVWELANSHEQPQELIGLYKPLTEEQLAWAVSKDNHTLAAEANAALERWHANGFLRQSIRQWVPVTISVSN